MKQKVVVIGHGYTSRLGVVRALGIAGYEVIVVVVQPTTSGKAVRNVKPIDCYSKYVSRYFFCTNNGDALIDLLLTKCVDNTQKVVLFPDSDFSAAVIDKNQNILSEHYLFPHINHEQGAVVAWMDKIRQKKLAADIGLNVAKGTIVEVDEGDYTLPSDLEYPCFPKPLATLVGAKTGMARCDNESELRKSLALLIKRSAIISVLVEEYKKIDTEYALMGFSDGKTVIIPGIIRTISLANGGHFGVAKQGVLMPADGFEEVVGRFKQYVIHTGYCGIFDIDFYESDGKLYFCEMNFRYGGSGYAYTKMGVNLPDIYVKEMLGHEWKSVQASIKDSKIFVNERMSLDDWYQGFISFTEYKSILRGSDISFVYDEDDTQPGSIFDWMVRLYRFKYLVKKFLCKQL